jgi:DNA-binding Xre family transcriptional regulator
MDDTQTLSGYVAAEIRAVLARRRVTGRDLAAQLQVSRSWVSYRLTGTTAIDLNDLERIAKALGVEIIDLLPRPARPEGGVMRQSNHVAHTAATATRTAQPAPGHHPTTHPASRPHPCPAGRPARAAAATTTGRPRRQAWLHDQATG